MTLKLNLPHELESELAAEAERLNMPLSEYILRILTIARFESTRPETGAQLVDYWQQEGLIGTQPDITDSQDHARALRDMAERRAPN